MSVVLLRTLTRKSLIKFGAYSDLTVQNLLDTHRYKELLHIYYTCRNIDFNQDLKDELCISGEREIDKKIKKEERYIEKTYQYIGWCMKEMIDKKSEQQTFIDGRMMYKIKQNKKKQTAQREGYLKRTIYSKGAMQRKNQGK